MYLSNRVSDAVSLHELICVCTTYTQSIGGGGYREERGSC